MSTDRERVSSASRNLGLLLVAWFRPRNKMMLVFGHAVRFCSFPYAPLHGYIYGTERPDACVLLDVQVRVVPEVGMPKCYQKRSVL
jgi:hypothetical protein